MVFTLLILLLGLVVYYYGGYPLLIALLAQLRAKPWRRDENYKPMVSVILAVYNEEAVIVKCLQSILQQEYPVDKLEILVGSDCSSDKTNVLLEGIANDDPRVKIHLFTDRRGKIPVVNDLVRAAQGDVLVFADADITFVSRAIACHARHYADQSVGCVAGLLTYRGNQEDLVMSSEKDYMSFENKLRMNEALVHSTVGIFGGNYSLRHSEFREIPNAPICDELYSALQVIQRGKRTVFDPEAVTPETFARTLSDEFKRKSRFAARGLTTMTFFPAILFGRFGLVSLILWSHKTLRYLMPIVLILIVLISIVAQVAVGAFYLTGMNVLIGLVLTLFVSGAILDKLKIHVPLISHCFWLLVMYVAFTIGTWKFVFGKERQFWSQATRAKAVVKPASMTNVMGEKEAV